MDFKAASSLERELALKQALAARIALARKLARLSVAQVAEHFGISVQAVYDWEKSDKKPSTPDAQRLHRFAELTGVRPEWLLTGSGDAFIHSPAEGFERRGRHVPKIAAGLAASGNAKDHEEFGSGVETCFACGANSYAIELSDKSNAPDFMPGDVVVIDPDLPPAPGDMVLAVVSSSSEPVFRRYRALATQGNPETIELIPLNDDWKRYFVGTPAEGRILGVMTEHSRPRR